MQTSMAMRRGREYYSPLYEKAVALHEQGAEIKEIARQLRISYSCVYHWVRGLRKPEAGNVSSFAAFLRQSGPAAVAAVKAQFPKHNELFLIAARRGLPVKRHVLPRRFGEYATWYYVEGQEDALQARMQELYAAVRKVKEALEGMD